MATDKERREAAESMREYGNKYRAFYGAFIEEIIGSTCGSVKEAWHRLADLIEPGLTCDREALLELADEMKKDARIQREREKEGNPHYLDGLDVMEYASRIRHAVNDCQGGSDAPAAGDKAQDDTEAHDEGEGAAYGGWTDLGSFMEIGTLYACSEQMHDAANWVEENGGLEAVKARLMPEGMEWPRFDTGEPVRIGDFFEHSISGHHFRIHNILFTEDCAFIDSEGDDYLDRFEFGERVKSSPEKALDAYGMECNKGDTVWLARRFRLRAGEAALCSSGECGLAGVGKYDALKISGFFEDKGGIIFARFDHNASPWCPVSWLTHKNPDTWAELEEDMKIGVNPTMDERIEWFERARELAKGVS